MIFNLSLEAAHQLFVSRTNQIGNVSDWLMKFDAEIRWRELRYTEDRTTLSSVFVEHQQ